MDSIQWDPVDVTSRSVPRGKPYARVSNSSVTFNGVAAAYIDDIMQYPYVLVRVGRVDGRPAKLAFQFVKEQQPGVFAVRKQSKRHKGVTVFSRALVKRYFGTAGIGIVMMVCEVNKMNDTTLVVELPDIEGEVRAAQEEVQQAIKEVGQSVQETINEIDKITGVNRE